MGDMTKKVSVEKGWQKVVPVQTWKTFEWINTVNKLATIFLI